MNRLAAALALAGLAAAMSYPLQTLWANQGATTGVVALPILGAPIPFYWRVLMMGFHGVLVGSLSALGLSDSACLRVLAWLPIVAPVAVLPLAALMVVFP